MNDEQINEATTKESSVVRENCLICGSQNSATFDHHNGGWTKIKCSSCGGGRFYLWIVEKRICTQSLTLGK
jgi:hypothetical protein